MIQEKTSTAVGHSHRYRLDEVNGLPTVGGVCITCGATREFRTWLDEEFAVKGSRRKERAS